MFNKKFLPSIQLVLEISLICSLILLLFSGASAEVGENATALTNLTVGNSFPEVTNVSIDDDAATVELNPNATKLVSCATVITDYNGQGDVDAVNATFYDSSLASSNDPDDNNTHYTNYSCVIDNDTAGFNGYADDPYNLLANCTFEVQYYANPGNWVCNITTNDSLAAYGRGYDEITVSELLALGVPDIINYGIVNATEVSEENQTNVTNYGNVKINLSLSGYAVTEEDGWAMNCSQGNVQNISIEYEKYNLTASNTSTLTLAQFENIYKNLTDTPVVNDFQLDYNQNDAGNNVSKASYWRIYVPIGVAGECTGNIIFGATKAAAS